MQSSPSPIASSDPGEASTTNKQDRALPSSDAQLHPAIAGLAAALAVLPVLYRLGIATSLLVVLLAVGINAIPDARQIIDSLLGAVSKAASTGSIHLRALLTPSPLQKSPSGRHRLANAAPSLNGSTSSSTPAGTAAAAADKVSVYDDVERSDQFHFVGLDVGEALQGPLNTLIDLVQRDFVSFWYNNSIALSQNTPFPVHTRSFVNATMNNLVTRVRRQDPKEVSIYLFHSASSAVINQVRETKGQSPRRDVAAEKEDLLRKVRRTSEELLLTLSPRSATASPLVLSLMSEVLSLQIWSTIQSVGNPDFINTTIVSNFGEAVAAVKAVQKKVKAGSQDAAIVSEATEALDSPVLLRDPVQQVLDTAPGAQPIEDTQSPAPPALPPRSGKGKGRARTMSDALAAPGGDTTYAASNLPGMIPTASLFSPQEVAARAVESSNQSASASAGPSASSSGGASLQSEPGLGSPRVAYTAVPGTGTRSNPPSLPSSPRMRQAKLPGEHGTSLTDKTLDEAIDAGVLRIKSFGSKFLNNASKFLDAALPPDDRVGISPEAADKVLGHGKRRSLHTSSSGVGGVTGAGPSLKGKERERDPAEYSPRGSIDSLRSPSRPASISSKMSIGSSSGAIGGTGMVASTSGSGGSRRSSITGGLSGYVTPAMVASGNLPPSTSNTSSLHQQPAHAPASTQQTLSVPNQSARCMRIIGTFATSSEELRAKQIKALEHSLFSKDLDLLLPEPQDPRLKMILARHTAAEQMVDPDLIELSESFHDYLEQESSGTGEGLLRLWTQLDHYTYMVDITKPSEAQLQEDALSLLRKSVQQTNDLEGILNGREGSSDTDRSYWTAVEMTLLRLAQNPGKEVFEPLQDWLLREVQARYWENFLRQNPRNLSLSENFSLPMSAGPSSSSSSNMYRSASSGASKPPSPSTSKRTLDWSNAALPADDSMDLGDSMNAQEAESTTPSALESQARGQSDHIFENAREDVTPSVHEPTEISVALATPTLGQSIAEREDAAVRPSNDSSSTLNASESLDLGPPAFTITLTDLSPPSAYVNNHVKNRKELEFLIAVEVERSPGYILARKYTEFEKMDAGIKKALPDSGTKAFPRAPLPSTNFQTSENLCHSLEHYLEALLSDDRYASSEPVATFFAKERTDSKGDVQPLAFLGRGVNNIGKGVTGVTRGIGKGGEMAIGGIATGFNQFGKAVTTFPGLRKSPSSLSVERADKASTSPAHSTSDLLLESVAEATTGHARNSGPSGAADAKEENSASVADSDRPVEVNGDAEISGSGNSTVPPPLPPRAGSPEGYQVIAPADKANAAGIAKPTPAPLVIEDERPRPPPGFNYTPRKKTLSGPTSRAASVNASPAERQSPLPAINVPVSPVVQGKMSFDELLQQEEEHRRSAAMAQSQQGKSDTMDVSQQSAGFLQAKPLERLGSADSSNKSVNGDAGRSPSPLAPTVALSPVEFNNVLSFAMAILEEAYDLVDSTWNIKRGILKVLETLLRTSYAGVIKAGVTRMIAMVSDEVFYVKNIEALRKSFWPPPDDVWWSSVAGAVQPERTSEEKEATRKEARRLILLQAPEGLKVSLGASATAEAFGRLHDALQGPGGERIVSALILDYLRLLLL